LVYAILKFDGLVIADGPDLANKLNGLKTVVWDQRKIKSGRDFNIARFDFNRL